MSTTPRGTFMDCAMASEWGTLRTDTRMNLELQLEASSMATAGSACPGPRAPSGPTLLPGGGGGMEPPPMAGGTPVMLMAPMAEVA